MKKMLLIMFATLFSFSSVFAAEVLEVSGYSASSNPTITRHMPVSSGGQTTCEFVTFISTPYQISAPDYKEKRPQYLACGEKKVDGKETFEGNGWLSVKSLKGRWEDYRLRPAEGKGPAGYGSFIVWPQEVKELKLKTVRFSVVQPDERGKTPDGAWSQARLFKNRGTLLTADEKDFIVALPWDEPCTVPTASK